MTGRSSRRGSPRRGIALFVALWLVVAIGVVALQFDLEGRQQRLVAANMIELADARATAHGGIDHALARLERTLRLPRVTGQGANQLRAADPWLDADTLVRIDPDSGSIRYHVRVSDIASRLNVNSATETQLRLLFTGLGFDFSTADHVAQEIIDWRDVNDLNRPQGAEREQYVREGRLILPRDGPVQDLAELRHVLHMTGEMFDSIAPFLRVDGAAAINVNSAPQVVLATLPGFTDATVAGVMRVRLQGRRILNLNELRQMAGGGGGQITSSRVTFEARELRVTSTGWNAGGRTAVRVEALLRRGAGTSSAITVAWRREM
jgi:general secretion pathway protein K